MNVDRTIAAAARVRRELFPAQKHAEITGRTALLRGAFREVVPEQGDREISDGRAHGREVADHVPAETRPDRLDAERIAGALDGGPTVEISEEGSL